MVSMRLDMFCIEHKLLLTQLFLCIDSEGASSEKINLGLSFYGRSFVGATGLNQSHQGVDKANWSADEGTPQYCKGLVYTHVTFTHMLKLITLSIFSLSPFR